MTSTQKQEECAAGTMLRKHLGQHPDFPQKGILFYDIFPIFRNPVLTEMLITAFMDHIFTVTLPKVDGNKIDAVVGLDARGFLFGPLIALRLCAGFVPVRKRGKLPGKCVQAKYMKEYGEVGLTSFYNGSSCLSHSDIQDIFELQDGAIQQGQNVLIIDDLIATGGSAAATEELIEKAGGAVAENLFCVELTFLKGRNKLKAPTWSLILNDD